MFPLFLYRLVSGRIRLTTYFTEFFQINKVRMNHDCFLLIGPTDQSEFHELAARLTALGNGYGTESHTYMSLAEAEEQYSEGARLVLLLESRPGEYPPKQVARFRRFLPNVPILLIAGTLCQGEGRTGRLPAGVIRFYLHEADTALLPELARFFAHQPSRLSLPATATEEDFWRGASFDPAPGETIPLSRTEPGRTAVAAADPAMRSLLAGFESHAAETAALASLDDLFRLGAPPDRIVIDLTLPIGEFLPHFLMLAEHFPKSEFVICAFAPAAEEISRLRAAGARVTVLSKPFFRLACPVAGTY